MSRIDITCLQNLEVCAIGIEQKTNGLLCQWLLLNLEKYPTQLNSVQKLYYPKTQTFIEVQIPLMDGNEQVEPSHTDIFLPYPLAANDK